MSGVDSSLFTILSPPKDEPLCLLPRAFRLRRQMNRKQRPKPMAAAPTPPTTTPATCGFVRTGVDDDAEAAAAAAVVEADGFPIVGALIMPPAGGLGGCCPIEEVDIGDEVDVTAVLMLETEPEDGIDAEEFSEVEEVDLVK